ncbi:MAG: hypothetical protein NT051_02040, partial [Candidatus Micrarchaeota archaeon]|nr:hypothetical protein [Candidatus Micrarchaeota archaeon]
ASEGNSSDGSCQWDTQGVHYFYNRMATMVQPLASSGVIGASYYEFIDHTGPLPCNSSKQGCEFGVVSANGSQKLQIMNTWASNCKYFGQADYRSPLVYSRNGFGTVCDFAQNNKAYNNIVDEINPDPASLRPVAPTKKQKEFSCGEVCPSNYPFPDSEIYDSSPHFSFDASHCLRYPLIDVYADSADISSTYFRAIVEHESAFDPEVNSCVDINGPQSPFCNTGRPTDPSDTRNYYNMGEICEFAGIALADCLSECPAGQKPCAYGLSQAIFYPGQYYAQTGNPMPPQVSGCGGANYNPFDSGDSICVGIAIFKSFLGQASRDIDSSWSVFSSDCTGGLEENERDWAKYFLASAYYSSGSGNVANVTTFRNQRDNSSACSGETNYIKFLGNRTGGHFPKEFMTVYRDAVRECGSDCPN